MRRSGLPLALIVLAFAPGCACSPPPATSINLVAKNTLDFDIFVPNDAKQGGLTVARAGSDGALSPVAEKPACACLECESACDSLDCTCTPKPMAHRIRKGESFTRVFDGNEHEATRASCGAGDFGPVCFQAGSPVQAGSYTLQLCYAANVKGSSAGTEDFVSSFDSSALTCVTKSFDYPDDTTWEISPPAPTPCSATNACPTGQLCQKGVCSASCLGNTVPPLGQGWDIAISIIDDEGFFDAVGSDPVRYTGTGQIGQANYTGSDMRLTLTRVVGAGRASGQIEVMLPKGVTPVTFIPGETVAITIVQAGSTRKSSAAVTIRDANGLLLLGADMGRGGPLLSSDDLAPFSVSGAGTPFACDESDICGRKTHSTIVFNVAGAPTAVEPGQTETVNAGSTAYAVTAVENYADRAGSPRSDCDPEGILEFAIGAQRQF